MTKQSVNKLGRSLHDEILAPLGERPLYLPKRNLAALIYIKLASPAIQALPAHILSPSWVQLNRGPFLLYRTL